MQLSLAHLINPNKLIVGDACKHDEKQKQTCRWLSCFWSDFAERHKPTSLVCFACTYPEHGKEHKMLESFYQPLENRHQLQEPDCHIRKGIAH